MVSTDSPLNGGRKFFTNSRCLLPSMRSHFSKTPQVKKQLVQISYHLGSTVGGIRTSNCSGKKKTPNIYRPRSKQSRLFSNVGDHIPVEIEGRRRCERCTKSKIHKRTKFMYAAYPMPLFQGCFTPYHN